MTAERVYSLTDKLIASLDDGVRTVFGRPPTTGRADPDAGVESAPLSEAERRLAEGLMRVNHTGEVCAQALYSAQAVTARDPVTRECMRRAALEENDHLDWCERRVRELGGHLSYLNPLWYLGSFAIGAAAGVAGDRWNLGFVVETEYQVVRHLDSHLRRLPPHDRKSRSIVEQMKTDELRHATTALKNGAAELPGFVKTLMKWQSRAMTTVSYWV